MYCYEIFATNFLALNTVFGSFYLDEITVEPKVVVGVLAASTMFQLEGLIEQCCEIMLETISPLVCLFITHYSKIPCNIMSSFPVSQRFENFG